MNCFLSCGMGNCSYPKTQDNHLLPKFPGLPKQKNPVAKSLRTVLFIDLTFLGMNALVFLPASLSDSSLPENQIFTTSSIFFLSDLQPNFDMLYNHVKQLLSNELLLTQMEKCALMEALVLISNQFKNYERQKMFLEELMAPVASIWLSEDTHRQRKPIAACAQAPVLFRELCRSRECKVQHREYTVSDIVLGRYQTCKGGHSIIYTDV